MTRHECCECRHMKCLEDEHNRIYYFCTFSQSPCFLEEVGVCEACSLNEWEESLYQEVEEQHLKSLF